MQTRYEILVQINGENQYLDTFETESVSLNFSIQEIQDISASNGAYSKTINLPDTNHNRAVFKYIFSMTSDSTFNPAKKSKCWVLRDTVIQLEGYIQLVDITYDRKTNKNVYNTVIYGDNNNLFTNIGDKFLTDLDVSRFNHNYNNSSVTASWLGDYTLGYYYPFIDYYGSMNYTKVNQGLNVTNFKPALYLKPIFDQVILEGGYSYTSDFLNSGLFKNLILPFNNSVLLPQVVSNLISDNNTIFIAGLSNAVGAGLSAGPVSSYEYNSFNCDVDIYDPNSFYDTSGFKYSMPAYDIFAQRFKINLEFIITGNAATTTMPWVGTSDKFVVSVRRSQNAAGVTVSGWSNTPSNISQIYGGSPIAFPAITFGGATEWTIGYPVIGTNIGGGQWRYNFTMYTDYLTGASTSTMQPLRPGEEVRFFFIRYGHGFSTPAVTTRITSATRISSEINPAVMAINAGVSASSLLPNNVKQKDFITSITKMFNLYWEPDKNNANNFIIEPRDDYYEKYKQIRDWSAKLDLSKPIRSEIASNTQKRVNLYSYKADKDLLNTKYTELTNQIYGQYEFDVDNEFIDGNNKLSLVFSPTPINKLPGSANIYLPVITNANGNVTQYQGMQPRLLIRNPQPLSGGDVFNFAGAGYTSYPYVGPYDNPLSPTSSVNFGQVSSFYENFTDTTDNLFGLYWNNMMAELSDKDTRIVTANFYLNANDIAQFRFSDLIFCKMDDTDQLFRVNKIMDYDPSSETTTKVELITAKDYAIPRRKIPFNPNILIPIPGGLPSSRPAYGSINLDESNSIYTTGVIAASIDSSISSPNTIVVGNNIIANAPNSIIVGSNVSVNAPQASGLNIFGSNVTVEDNIQSGFIVGNNLTITQSMDGMFSVSMPAQFTTASFTTVVVAGITASGTSSFSDGITVYGATSTFYSPVLMNNNLSVTGTSSFRNGFNVINKTASFYSLTSSTVAEDHSNIYAGSIGVRYSQIGGAQTGVKYQFISGTSSAIEFSQLTSQNIGLNLNNITGAFAGISIASSVSSLLIGTTTSFTGWVTSVANNYTPTSRTEAFGTVGDVCYGTQSGSAFLYVKVAANRWGRIPLDDSNW